MTRISYIPNRIIDSDGIADGASVYVYESGTSTPVALFTDADYTVAATNPYEVSSGAEFPVLYTNHIGDIRVRIVSLSGTTTDEDPYYPLSAEAVVTTEGESLNTVALRPRKLSYGSRVPIRTIRDARAALETIHTEVVGYAKENGITGGYGQTEYYVDKPSFESSVENSLGWAIAEAKANGGGLIYFDPRGKFDIVVTDEAAFRFNAGDDNITIYAPGMNVTVWSTPLTGGTIIRGSNIIFKNIEFRTLAGPMSGDFDGLEVKVEQILVAVAPQTCSELAFINCEFRHSSDGAMDAAGTAFISSSPTCYITLQNCIFWDTDECTLLGSISDTSTAEDARNMFVTYYECIWAYCGQRQPKALGLALVDIVNCYTLMQPFARDNPTSEFGACHGASVQNGGWMRVRGCLWQSTDGVSGYEATKLVANPTSGETGYLDVVDCAAENGMTFATANGDLVPEATYTLAHTAVPDEGPEREAWIQDLWSRAGARYDAAPEGLFYWTDDTDAYPNGETVLIDRNRTGRYIRMDRRTEYPENPAGSSEENPSIVITPTSYNRTIGYTEGKTSQDAIGATALDIVNLDSSFFTITGNGGPANLKFIYSTGADGFSEGVHLILRSTASGAVTLKNATSQTVTVASTTDNTITATAHGMTTGDFPISITTSGTMPGGVTSNQRYFVVVVDANTLKLAESYADALAGTVIDITSTGTGTHTALIGNLNLPNTDDIVLDSTSKVVELVYDSSSERFGLIGRHSISIDEISDFPTIPTVPTLTSGAYTPTLTAVANCTSPTLIKAHYSQNEDIVTVTAKVNVTATTGATPTTVSISLPISSDLTVASDVIGTALQRDATPVLGYIEADITNNRADVTVKPASSGSVTILCVFQYEVK